MFDTFIVQPILNLLFIINSVLPGHDFGVSIIIFTIVIRMALWPLVKKQLHQTRAMKALQPEIKKIKEKTKGDKQKEGQLLMELYKEKNVSPFGSIGVLLLQLPILFGLFRVLRILSDDPSQAVDMLYGFVKSMPGVPDLVASPALVTQALTDSFWGVIDLTKSAFNNGSIYWPLMIIALLAGILQFFQSKQLMPDTDDSRSLRDILKEEANGNKSEQKDINAAVGKNMRYFMPLITIFFAASFPGALALYWAAGAGVAIIQQKVILSRDVEEMEEFANTKTTKKKANKSKNTDNQKKGSSKKKETSSSKKKKG
ncbi:Inner membrane protein translocase and chaperone YidC, short form OxaI-like [hydrothermal vent metagenome]|uniref:Inner membrane protein translocase and chaperone YidC, short form OxaI-like n=1 Tax=hydrothermal vent metagenome TaxID=652676 RepID=A0A3B0V702_9ZZZZ